jgi:ectoine hydroxylase-related dioxygenase (phytanoyl-CoA dioxygenase family)
MLPTIRRAGSSHGPTKSKIPLQFARIKASAKERNVAQLNHCKLQKALEEFHQNGFVILENAVELRSTEHIHQRMLQDFRTHLQSPRIHWNQGRNSGNISQSPPPSPEYLHEDIWANRLGVHIMEHIIGPKPQLSFVTSNIALPRSTGRQAVHSDYYCNHFDFPVFLEVNIYLHDVDSHNGATELWPGTHAGYSKADHSSSRTGWIKREVFTPRAMVSPPIQPAISKGSLMIRDLRCWHAGRANQTNDPRIVLGFIFSPQWFRSQMRMTFPCSSKRCLESWNHIDCLNTARFVTDDFDYLANCQEINLAQMPSSPIVPYVPQQGAPEITSQDYWTPP